jgi:hypothetical protein
MMRRYYFALVSIGVLGAALGPRVWAEPPGGQPAGHLRDFQGYWIGIDHVDGGDSRRSLVLGENGHYILAGRDTVFTLCDGTDRGFARFDDGEVIERGVMESNNLTITCFNNDSSVVLHVRYELVHRGLMIEHTTRQDGSSVSTIAFHKVNTD